MDLNLDLLLIGPATPVRHQIRRRRRDRPPILRQTPNRQIEVIDDLRLVADQPHDQRRPHPEPRAPAPDPRPRCRHRANATSTPPHPAARRPNPAYPARRDPRTQTHPAPPEHPTPAPTRPRPPRPSRSGRAPPPTPAHAADSARRRRHRRNEIRRLPTQILAALTKIAVVRVLTPAALTDPHAAPPLGCRGALTRRRYLTCAGFACSINRATAARRVSASGSSQ